MLQATRPINSRRLIVTPEAWTADRSNFYAYFGRGRCPLWVISGHLHCTSPCPLYPQERHRLRFWHVCFGPLADKRGTVHNGMSALPPKADMCGATTDVRFGPIADSALHQLSINSSARSSTVGGIVRPSALAVFRLIMSSNLVGCSTGISPGFEPLKIILT